MCEEQPCYLPECMFQIQKPESVIIQAVLAKVE